MQPYKSLTKAQLIELLNSIESSLSNAIKESHESAKAYSDDPTSRLAYEVGHLNGYINTCTSLITGYKKYGVDKGDVPAFKRALHDQIHFDFEQDGYSYTWDNENMGWIATRKNTKVTS